MKREDFPSLFSIFLHINHGTKYEIRRIWLLSKEDKEEENMQNRPEITKLLSRTLEHYLNPNNDTRIYLSKEVTFDYASDHRIRVDYMRFQPVNNSVSGIEKGNFYCYEIKSSVEDFHSKNGHNFIGDYNYYVMPEDVYNKIRKEIPFGVGVLTSSSLDTETSVLSCVKKAGRKNREKSATEMLFMMFRSAARDVTNYKKKKEEVNE